MDLYYCLRIPESQVQEKAGVTQPALRNPDHHKVTQLYDFPVHMKVRFTLPRSSLRGAMALYSFFKKANSMYIYHNLKNILLPQNCQLSSEPLVSHILSLIKI